MEIEKGSVLEGKVAGITKFGAFVTVAPGKQGLVHISEISGDFVTDVSEYLSEGQAVTVKVIAIDDNGLLSLSIKAAAPPPVRTAPPVRSAAPRPAPQSGRPYPAQSGRPTPRPRPAHSARFEAAAEPTFEDKLKRFMQDSDSKMSGLKQYSSPKGKRRK